MENIALELILADGSIYPDKGKFALADRQIDAGTGTLKVGSLFPNPGNILRPGGFGLIRALMEVKKGGTPDSSAGCTEMSRGNTWWPWWEATTRLISAR